MQTFINLFNNCLNLFFFSSLSHKQDETLHVYVNLYYSKTCLERPLLCETTNLVRPLSQCTNLLIIQHCNLLGETNCLEGPKCFGKRGGLSSKVLLYYIKSCSHIQFLNVKKSSRSLTNILKSVSSKLKFFCNYAQKNCRKL